MRSEAELMVDVLGGLNAAGVEYMLTGAMASNYWGIPRTTHDLDFVLVMRPDQVDGLVSSFDPGFFIQPDSVRSAFRPPSSSTCSMANRRSRPTSGCCATTRTSGPPSNVACR